MTLVILSNATAGGLESPKIDASTGFRPPGTMLTIRGQAGAQTSGAISFASILPPDRACRQGSFSISEIILDSELTCPYIQPIPIHLSRGAFRRRSVGGERERHLRAMGDATSSPGRTRAASSATMEPARSDHGQRHKGQDAALARRKAWGAPQVRPSSGVI